LPRAGDAKEGSSPPKTRLKVNSSQASRDSQFLLTIAHLTRFAVHRGFDEDIGPLLYRDSPFNECRQIETLKNASFARFFGLRDDLRVARKFHGIKKGGGGGEE